MYNRKCVNKDRGAKWEVHLHTHRAGFCPDVGSCHKIPGSEIKDFITHGIACDLCITCVLVLLAPKSHEGDTEVDCCTYSGFALELRNLKLRKCHYFKESCQQICSTFASEEYIIFIILINKKSWTLPQKGYYLYLPMLCAIQTSMKRWSRASSLNASVWKTCRSVRDSCRTTSQHVVPG